MPVFISVSMSESVTMSLSGIVSVSIPASVSLSMFLCPCPYSMFCSIDMRHGHGREAGDMDIQHGDMDMQNGHVAWRYVQHASCPFLHIHGF
jgi:hypothetical protein